jgi:hypothetical protein
VLAVLASEQQSKPQQLPFYSLLRRMNGWMGELARRYVLSTQHERKAPPLLLLIAAAAALTRLCGLNSEVIASRRPFPFPASEAPVGRLANEMKEPRLDKVKRPFCKGRKDRSSRSGATEGAGVR